MSSFIGDFFVGIGIFIFVVGILASMDYKGLLIPVGDYLLILVILVLIIIEGYKLICSGTDAIGEWRKNQ